jgi:hypothetical protein
MRNFTDSFNEFIMSQVYNVGTESAKDPEHIELSAKQNKLYQQLTELLPTDKYHLLDKFASNESLLATLEADYSYRQGMKDGIEMKSVLGITN